MSTALIPADRGDRRPRLPRLLDLSLGGKLAVSFSIVVALLVAVAVTSLVSLSTLTRATHQITRSSDERVQAAQDIRFAAAEMQSAQFTYVMAHGQFRDGFTQATSDFSDGMNELRHVAATRADKIFLGKVSDEFQVFLGIDAKIWGAVQRRDDTLAQNLTLGAESLDFGNIAGDAADYTDAVQQDKIASVKSFEQERSQARLLLFIFTALALVLSIAVAFLLRRSLVRRIRSLVGSLQSVGAGEVTSLREGLDAVAAGDLTLASQSKTDPVLRTSRDEIGEIAQAVEQIRSASASSIDSYNAMRERVAEMLRGIRRAAGSVTSASGQMATGSAETARTIHEISRAIEEVARGAEQQVTSIDRAQGMTQQVANATGESAESAREAKRAAEQARAVSETGVVAISEVTDFISALRVSSSEAADTIRELGQKSSQIGGIVGTITGIAEQTNLLALNAAIEAARAGDQGRGFAVVAEEVRKLAEESAQAAGSIASLIAEIQSQTSRAVDVVEDGVRQTEAGTSTVERAREAFLQVGHGVEELEARVSAIAAAIEEIASSSRNMQENFSGVAAIAEESSSSSQEVSASTQESTAVTEQVSAHAHDLARTAMELDEMVRAFTLANER